jgi:hypothetical protein
MSYLRKPEKLATLGTKDTERRHTKQSTICAGHHHTQDKDKQNQAKRDMNIH